MIIIEKLFIAIFDMSITSSIVFVFIVVLRALLTKVPKSVTFYIWYILLFRLICPFSFSTSFSIFKYIPNISSILFDNKTMPYTTNSEILLNNTVNISPVINNSLSSSTPAPFVITLISYIWLSGLISMLLYSIISYFRLKKKISSATFVSENIYETDEISSAFVCGLISPKIFIPISLNKSEYEYAICHEKTHIKKIDYIIKLFAFILLSIYWFNPLIWFAFKMLSQDIEMRCDESVLIQLGYGKKKEYSLALLNLSSKQTTGLVIPPYFGESNIKKRIKNILNFKSLPLALTVFIVLLIIIVAIFLSANPFDKTNLNTLDEAVSETDTIANQKTTDNNIAETDSLSTYSYEIIKVQNGTEVATYTPKSDAEKQFPMEMIYISMRISSAWPSDGLDNISEYYIIKQSNGTETAEYYAYILDEKLVLQHGYNGYYNSIGNLELYEEICSFFN